jgi:hypothetical protein
MGQYERLVMMAEDELTQYSTNARKMEKLRQKIGLSVPAAEQKVVKETLLSELPQGGLAKIVEEQRQAIALPFWGIAGLSLLLGISMTQPLDMLIAVPATILAFRLQKWGWKLEAKRLLLNTLEEIEERVKNPKE